MTEQVGEKMKQDKIRFTSTTEFNDTSIRLMFKTEYFTFEKKLLAMRIGFAALLLAVGMFAGLPVPAQALCLLVGVWLIVALDFPSKIRAEGVIQKRGGAVSSVDIIFTETDIRVDKRKLAYKKVTRLVEDKDYCFVFENRQNAVMVDKSTLEPGSADDFKAFIEEKTGLTFRRNVNILSMNLFDLLGISRKSGKKNK